MQTFSEISLAALILTGGLSSIPSSVIEAAKDLGSKSGEILYRVILPMLKSSLTAVFFLIFVKINFKIEEKGSNLSQTTNEVNKKIEKFKSELRARKISLENLETKAFYNRKGSEYQNDEDIRSPDGHTLHKSDDTDTYRFGRNDEALRQIRGPVRRAVAWGNTVKRCVGRAVSPPHLICLCVSVRD